jgi:hypothetical protein
MREWHTGIPHWSGYPDFDIHVYLRCSLSPCLPASEH